MLDGSGATKHEVDRAINTLTPTERLKLKHFAAWTVWGLGTASCGRSWEDLLGEAIATTLAGARNNGRGRTWRIANVDFVTHLSGAMRSIASHWRRDFREGKAHPESEVLTCTDDDDQISRLNQIASTDPSPESELIVRDILDRLSRKFPTSSGPGKVITGWKKISRPLTS
jgi:hypothetical protein